MRSTRDLSQNEARVCAAIAGTLEQVEAIPAANPEIPLAGTGPIPWTGRLMALTGAVTEFPTTLATGDELDAGRTGPDSRMKLPTRWTGDGPGRGGWASTGVLVTLNQLPIGS